METADPVTVAMAATGGAALLGAGTSVAGGFQAQSAGRAAQAQARNEAIAATQASGAETGATATEAARTVSRVEAGAGAAGITAESARPVLSEDAAESRIRMAYQRYSGNLASQQALYGGQLAKYQGGQQLQAGITGGIVNVLGGASTLGQWRLKNLKTASPSWGQFFGTS